MAKRKIEVEDLIWDLMEIPERENPNGDLNQFWRDIESPNLKTAMVFCILNTLRTAPTESLTENQCRTVLAKCQGYVSLLDLPEVLSAQKKKQEDLDEASPFDTEQFDE